MQHQYGRFEKQAEGYYIYQPIKLNEYDVELDYDILKLAGEVYYNFGKLSVLLSNNTNLKEYIKRIQAQCFLKLTEEYVSNCIGFEHKNSKEYRKMQIFRNKNYYTNMPEFNPISSKMISEYMDDMEVFLVASELDVILKLALICYQLKRIMPFEINNDAYIYNTLLDVLKHNHIIEDKIYYIFDFASAMDTFLLKIDKGGTIDEYIKDFLELLKCSAQEEISMCLEFMERQKENTNKISHLNYNQQKLLLCYEKMEYMQIFSITDISKKTELSYNTVAKIVQLLLGCDVIQRKDDFYRNKKYIIKI